MPVYYIVDRVGVFAVGYDCVDTLCGTELCRFELGVHTARSAPRADSACRRLYILINYLNTLYQLGSGIKAWIAVVKTVYIGRGL